MPHNALVQYLNAIEQTLAELSNAYVEKFSVVLLTAERANLKLRIRFKGQYLLAISEAILIVEQKVTQIDYRYHFQNENNELIFRYDSTPHFPDLRSFPHHKHLPDQVIASSQPRLIQVIEEASQWTATH